MLKTYRIIPLVFILFLFGFTFITVSLVSADERDAFVQCQEMPTQPNNFKSLKRQKNCFRDVAKRLGAKKREGAFGACQRIKPNRVSTQKMQQKIDCFMDVASSLMPNTAPPAGAIGMPPTMAAPPAASPAAPQWDPSMGMCHNSRPCMKSNMCGQECDRSVRASKGWVEPNQNPLEGQGTPPSGEICSVRDCSPSSDVAALRSRFDYMYGTKVACEKCTNHKHEGIPPYNIWTCDLPPDTKLKCY
jgi:hypothetical protein